MLEKFEAGAIQFDVKKGRIRSNLDTILNYLDQMAQRQVRLALLPEMFSCSFDNENLSSHSEDADKILSELGEAAKKYNMVIAGSLPEQKNDQIFNTLVVIEKDGTIAARYRKTHLFRLTGEHHFYTAGNEVVVADTSVGRIGLMICYDLRFPELARSMMLSDADILLVPAQWPSKRSSHWQTLAAARAIENQLFVITANRTGAEDGLTFPGMSMIVDPLGNRLAEGGDTPDILTAEIDLELIARTRETIPCRTDRRTDIYG